MIFFCGIKGYKINVLYTEAEHQRKIFVFPLDSHTYIMYTVGYIYIFLRSKQFFIINTKWFNLRNCIDTEYTINIYRYMLYLLKDFNHYHV